MKNELTIIIIGRNEEAAIGKCVEAALNAAREIGGADLLYIDSHSTDNTIVEVSRYGIDVKMLDIELRPSPSAARHFGSAHAKSEYILFLDADTLLYPDFLPDALDQLRSEATLAGINGRIDDTTEAGEAVAGIDPDCEEPHYVQWLRGPCCLYRREALDAVGSFDPELATEEEAELGLRLIRAGWDLKMIPVPMARHTRCYHPSSATSLLSTFIRDLNYGRLGEISVTVLHAFRAGNGLAFCRLRLMTTTLFLAWCSTIGALLVLLPANLRPELLSLALLAGGLVTIFAKKRSLSETLLFIPARALNVAELLVGVPKIIRFPRRRATAKV